MVFYTPSCWNHIRCRIGAGTLVSSSRSTSCRKTKYLAESSRGSKLYGPIKLSPTIPVYKLTVKRCCAARVHVGCLRPTCARYVYWRPPSSKMVASSQNNMELAKCKSAALWLTNLCAGDHLAVITALSVHETDRAVHDGHLIKIFQLQWKAPNTAIGILVHCMQNSLFKYGCFCYLWQSCTFNHGSEGSIFHQVMMHLWKHLMIGWPPCRVSFSIQPYSSKSISIS